MWGTADAVISPFGAGRRDDLSQVARVSLDSRHPLLLQGLDGHPLLSQRISCYQIDVALDRGAAYVLVEDREQSQALVLRDDTGEPVASGRLVDRPSVFVRTCRWE